MHKKILIVVGLTILFLGTCITSSVAINNTIKPISSGNILYVGGTGPNNYTKIQDAIDDASDGDTVFVYDDSSPYYENLVVNKSINLIGEDKNTTIIDGSGEFSVVIYHIDEVKISGFTIRNGDYGIYTLRANNITINGNIILNNEIGVYLIASNFNTIKNNTITLNIYYGIAIIAHYITSELSKYNIVEGNNITSNNRYGIILGKSNFNIITENNFIQNEKDALFMVSFQNHWNQNYWNRPRILPKLIFGSNLGFIPWFNIDWHPAKEPYVI